MKKEIKIYFDKPLEYDLKKIQNLNGHVGLYFIFKNSDPINYPFANSKLLYIGMSEKKTNSIGKRLAGHFDGSSKNIGLTNFRSIAPLYFTYLNFDVLKSNWTKRIEDLENYFLNDFVEKYGVYPICNNKSSKQLSEIDYDVVLNINWQYFN